MHAKFAQAVLYMEDGSVKKGLAELVASDASKVVFKTDENAKKEKIASTDVKKITFTDTDGKLFTAERLYAVTANILSGKFSRSKKKQWFYIIYEKSAKIGYISEPGSNRPNAGGTSRVITMGSTSYFFGKKDSEDLVFGYSKSGGLSVSVGTLSLIRKMSREAFASCPKIIEAIEKEEFKDKDVLSTLQSIFEKYKCK